MRYRYGLSGRTMDLPVLRLDVAENPTPEPFDPAAIETMFARVRDRMAEAEAVLATITDTDAVAMHLNLGDLWFPVGYRREQAQPTADYLADAPWSAPPPAA